MYTTLITNGRIVDGSGNPWRYGDVALADDRVAAIAPPGSIDPDSARDVVDAAGHVVAPGFIDILSHSILPLMLDGRCLSKITQGVTTEIMGEGWTPAPFIGRRTVKELQRHHLSRRLPDWMERIPEWGRFRDWLDAMLESGVSPNIGSFLGGGSLRSIAMGYDMGAPSADQLALMQRTMAAAMDDGAFGVSMALIYPPSAYTATNELVDIARIAGERGGVYITHLRSEADDFLAALEEAVTIGREANVPVEIYHLKAAGKPNWYKMDEAIARINRARADGIDITADLYPYRAGGTGLTSILPPWAVEGDRLHENLADPRMRARIRAEALNPSGGWEALAALCGPEGVVPVALQNPENQAYVGKSLAEIGDMREQHWLDAAMDILLSEEQRIAALFFWVNEGNIRRQLQQPWMTIGTDAGGFDPAWAADMGPTHPRAYGTYARILGRYVRDEQVIPLEDAVRKMSGAVAARLGIRDRGLLREGMAADVVIFDPATVADHATYTDSHQLSTGVRDVWINGARVLVDGEHTGATPGRIVTPG
ncbi:MAG: D-aminoacylase [Caldilineaceae bacterium]|nr:D-aminoacylase [Caldilineaceae bacterium]